MKRCWILLVCLTILLTACNGNQTSTESNAAEVKIYAPGGEMLATYTDVKVSNISETCVCIYLNENDEGTLYKNVTAIIEWN